MSTGSTSIFKNIFRGLDEEGLDALRQVAEVHNYPEQTTLIQQGETGKTFYVVVEGRVAVTQRFDDGQERLLGIRGPREFFGELSLLDETPRMANCVTLTPTRVLEVTEEVFDKVLESSPVIAYTIMRHVVEMLRDNDRISINGLMAKNKQLQEAYEELKSAQANLIDKERLERELEIAGEVQRSILPGMLPLYPDYSFAAYLEPARHIGGDLYNVIELDEEHIGILLADVADKSIQAALYMAVTMTLYQVEAKRSLSPAQVSHAVHKGLLDISAAGDIFVTAFYGVLHRPSRYLTYIIAGQERPLLLRKGQPISKLPGRGRFLGMINPLELNEFTAQLDIGDKVLIYSDGAIDAENKVRTQFGYEGLLACLNRNRNQSAPELIHSIASDIKVWYEHMPAFDDLTLLAVEVL
jgi:serine phosphatase RsbU (regulator of sigma subunit)